MPRTSAAVFVEDVTVIGGLAIHADHFPHTTQNILRSRLDPLDTVPTQIQKFHELLESIESDPCAAVRVVSGPLVVTVETLTAHFAVDDDTARSLVRPVIQMPADFDFHDVLS